MTKVVPILFVLLLVCSLPAMAVVGHSVERSGGERSTTSETLPATDTTPIAADSPFLTQEETGDVNTTSRLALDNRTKSGYVNGSPDLGTTLATQSDELHNEFTTYEIEHEWNELTVDEQVDLLDRQYEADQEWLDELWERERTIVAEHANGRLDDDALMRELVRIDREASSLTGNFRTLESRADEVPGYTLDLRGNLAQLDVHEGNVRDWMYQIMRGASHGDESTGVLLTSAESGLELSAVEGNHYIREVTVFDNRNENASNQFGTRDEVIDRANGLYPWVDITSDDTLYESWDKLLFRFVIPHSQGGFETYLDGGTGDVFYESQELFIDRLPNETSDETWEDDGLELSLVETPLNGPMEVTAADTSTGEPVDASVVIKVDDTEYRVAKTGTDGSVWILPPPDEYELTLETGDRSVSVPPDE